MLVSTFGALALLAALNGAAGWWLARCSSNLGYRLIRSKWDSLRALDAPVDWLVLGDSSGNQGIRPPILAERLGGRVRNYCTIGDMLLLDDAWMLRDYLSRFPPPRGVLLVHVYDVWRRTPNISVLSQAPLSWGQWLSLRPRPPLDADALIERLATRSLPIYSESTSLLELLKSPTLRRPNLPAPDADGFMEVDKANPSRVLDQTKGHLEFVHGTPFAPSRANLDALDEMIRLAEEKEFDLWYVTSPIYEGLAREPDFQRYFDRITEMLDERARLHPRLHVLFRRPETFPAESLENTDHVIGGASAEYSRRVADALAAAAAPRSR